MNKKCDCKLCQLSKELVSKYGNQNILTSKRLEKRGKKMTFDDYMLRQLNDPEFALMWILDAYNTMTEDGGLDLLLRRIEQVKQACEMGGRNRELPAALK